MSLFTELSRRNVIRVAIAYLTASWLLIQVADTIFPVYGLGTDAMNILITALAIGFPLFLVFSWVFEITPEGLKLETNLDLAMAATRRTGKQLDRMIIVLLALALGYFAFDKFVLSPQRRAEELATAKQEAHREGHTEALVESYGDKSIAVLPFVNMSDDAGNEYFSDGISEELLNLLAQIPELRVISRSSAFSFKGKDIDVPTIARQLGVAYILEGSVRKSGNQVRITAQLIEAHSDTHLWSETYDRELENIFAIQDDISAAITNALKERLGLRVEAAPRVTGATSTEAYDAYLKGLYHWYKLTREDLDAAERYFELALARDPDYARAHAGIALLWMGRNQMGFSSPAVGVPKAKAAALKAVELDDTLADAHYVLAIVYTWADWDWPAAEREFRRAIQLNPGYADAHAYFAHLLNILRRPDEAMVEARRSLELDPFNGLLKTLYGVDLLFVHRFDEAIAQFNAVLATEPTSLLALYNLMSAHHHKREYPHALEALRRLATAAGYSEVTNLLDHTAADADYSMTMRKVADVLVVRSKGTYVTPMDVAGFYAYAGDKDRCLEWLERAYEGRDPNLPYLSMPDLDFLRSDPRFIDLMQRMKLPD